MADIIYNRGKYLLLAGAFGGVQLDLRMAAVTGTAVGVDNPDLNTVAELDAVSGVSIHSERLTLTGEAVTQDQANNRAVLDAANPSFAAAASTTAVAVVVYHEGTGADSGRELVLCVTSVFPKPMDGGLNVTIADLLYANQG